MKLQRNERQTSQLSTAPSTRPASRALAAMISQAKTVTTRNAASLNASTETQFNDRDLDTVSLQAYSTDGFDSMVSRLLDSDDEPSSPSADRFGTATLEQRVHEAVQHYPRNNPVDQLEISDDHLNSKPRDAAKVGTSNSVTIEDDFGFSINGNTVSRAPGLDGQRSRQLGDSTGLEAEMGDGSDNNREVLSYNSVSDGSLHLHESAPGQAGHILGLRTSGEQARPHHSEDDVSLVAYLTSEPIRIASKLHRLEGITSNCDERLRSMSDSEVSERGDLTGYRNNVRIAKDRLETAQQMEQHCATFKSMMDSGDDTSSQQAQGLLNAASVCRKTCQEAYERTRAEMEAREISFNVRQEQLSLIEEEKRKATIELQAWRAWQVDGGKIFPSE